MDRRNSSTPKRPFQKNLHNHVPPSETKIAQCAKEKINKANASNPTLTASYIYLGKGLGFVPCAVDVASSHLGRVSNVVAIAKQGNGFSCQEWSPSGFESTAVNWTNKMKNSEGILGTIQTL